MQILAKEYSVYVFFLVTSIITWMVSSYNKNIVKKIKPSTLILFSTFISLVATFGFSSYENTDAMKDLSNLNRSELFTLGGVAAFMVVLRIFNNTLLKHHDVTTVQMASYIITMIVNGGAVYFTSPDTLSMNKIISYIIMCISGYIYTMY